ncbi:MAG TPA: FAD-binding oxidoreductase [Candidatus Paceibacterota bacterium]|nr:FAD-binding oxidoreductase [Candidatus Paceibacterota bacterium]
MLNVSDLQKRVNGEVMADEPTLVKYSRDASLFEVRPEAVVFPKDAADVEAVVKYVSENKAVDPTISVTGRCAGTDMSGGPLNESIIMDFSKYMNKLILLDDQKGVAQPGLFYRDFEKETLKRGRILPSYTASKELNTLGGMASNNSGGEKAIKYGKTERYVLRQKMVWSDGNEYEIKPLTKQQLDLKIAQGDFEAKIYKQVYDLIDMHYDEIEAAKPHVTKNSAGYYLWNVWDKEKQIFDLNKLLVGAQGTLGLTTEVEMGLVAVPKFSKMVVMYLPSIEKLGDIVDTVMKYEPESFESYDDYSMKLAIKFSFDFFSQLGFWGAIKLGIQFIPDLFKVLIGGVPKLILMAEVTGDDEQEVLKRAYDIKKAVKPFKYQTHVAHSAAEVEKYWKIRRESFNLLRKHVKGKQTAPFIDDIIVDPHKMPEFLPKLQAILDQYKLIYTIAGHAGNGNFHIIPLMDLNNPISGDIILELSKKVYHLVADYGGSITAEHNDGIIRTPFLPYMYKPDIIQYFAKIKQIFDPLDIFNPGKKVGGSFDYIQHHLVQSHNTEHGS